MRNLKFFLTTLIFSLLLAPSALAATTAVKPAVAPKILTTAVVAKAGFKNVKLALATKTKFLAPVTYFKVLESALTKFGWADVSNVVAVSVATKLDKDWQYNDGNIQQVNLAGRYQARFTTAKKYITITGPDKNKVLALAKLLQKLF